MDDLTQKYRLERIRRFIKLKVPGTVIENDFISYLKAKHGGGWRLINYLSNKFIAGWLEKKTIRVSYWWNIRVRKQSERAFFANRIGITEAEMAFMEDEAEKQ